MKKRKQGTSASGYDAVFLLDVVYGVEKDLRMELGPAGKRSAVD